ncbi:uncharacterized protein N7503_005289 [Penicillium pulvis]|uniref:uncharacterized protein n=1 Tax=Penicillium pulvis TaxID=1562058 RepID=UPI0025474902|nr:uncharacterized protein N7503_005289 [Penicillium pulvis]KAJ5802839.1 hypothetical protein N7503_005289 [Penicillium pulvis]
MTRAALVGTFTYPVENGLLYYDGETIDVSWTSTLSNASLSLYCRYETDSTWNTYEISSIGLVDSIGSKQVDVVIEKSSDYCWFNLFETGDDADGVNSVTFLISSDVHSGTTIGLSGAATTSYAGVGVPTGPVTAATTTATTTTTATATATTPDVTNSTSTSTIETSTKSVTASLASGKSSGDLSTGAKAGIGAGVGVASLMLLGACLLWFLRRKRGRGNGQAFAEGQRGTTKEKTALMDAVEIGATKGSAWHPDTVQEMRDSQRPFELHASTGPYTGHTAELDG